jgi:hypothetical protein
MVQLISLCLRNIGRHLLPSLSENTIVVEETRKPEALRTLFLIDVSASAANSDMLSDVCKAIFESVHGVQDCSQEDAKLVGLMTFDSALHFYDLSVSRRSFTLVRKAYLVPYH